MKKNWKITGIILVLVLALTLGITALAETADVPDTLPAEDAVTSATSAASADPALQEALDALSAARNSSKASDLEAELKAYVEAGTLTQDQADLILKAYRDQESLQNGICPNCGYQFSTGGFGKGGRMKNGSGGNMDNFGGKGGRGGHGRMQNGMQQNAAPDAGTAPDSGAAPDSGSF